MRSVEANGRGSMDVVRRALTRAVLTATAFVMLEPGLSGLVGLR